MAKTKDPLRNFKFVVEIDGIEVAGFNSVSGLSKDTGVIEYRTGDDEKNTMQKFQGLTSYDAITMTKGMVVGDYSLYKESNKTFDFEAGIGSLTSSDNKRDVHIIVKDYDDDETSKVEYLLQDAWMSRYETGALDSASPDVYMETVVLQIRGWTRIVGEPA